MSLISFNVGESESQLEILDNVESRKISLKAPNELQPVESDTADFRFPVDQAIAIEVDSLTISGVTSALIRNSQGFLVEEIVKGESRTFPADEYDYELNAPLKMYLISDGPQAIHLASDNIHIEFENLTKVLVGARSYHTQPAATIITTEEPRDMMKAVSALSSSLKTLSVERSYPTLRGHPPSIEIGEKLHIPDIIETPQTGIEIEVPPCLEYVYVVAPLSFYLGARIIPGSEPKITTETSFEYHLEKGNRNFEDEVERVLKQIFFLDCITRTEGYYPVILHQRNQIEDAVDLEYHNLYDEPISSQIEEYLQVSYLDLKGQIPTWNRTSIVEITPESGELLPYAINDLSVIKTENSYKINDSSHITKTFNLELNTEVFRYDSGDTQSHIVDWIGDGIPIGVNKAIEDSFINRIEASLSGESIESTVVVNGFQINHEMKVLLDSYDQGDSGKLDTLINPTTHELLEIFEEKSGFLHYIGEVDDDGITCRDGKLDIRAIEKSSIDGFFLNGCQSYQQAISIIEHGSITGIISPRSSPIRDILEEGSRLSRNLQLGVPFHAAVNYSISNEDNSLVRLGNTAVSLAKTESRSPIITQVSGHAPEFNLTAFSYPTIEKGLGSLLIPYFVDENEYYLISSRIGPYSVSEDELTEILSIETLPVIVGGEFVSYEQLNDIFQTEIAKNQYEKIDIGQIHHYFEDFDSFGWIKREDICRRALNTYNQIRLENLSVEHMINLGIIARHASHLGRDRWKGRAENLIDIIGGRTENTPIAPNHSKSTLKRTLSPEEARNILRKRERILENIASETFGEVDEEILRNLQYSYLGLIWKDIDFEVVIENSPLHRTPRMFVSGPDLYQAYS